MNGTASRLFVCVVFACLLFAYTHGNCKNEQPAPNLAHITEHYLIVMNVMESFERNASQNYSTFFDEALMHEARYMIRRLRGFARDQVQSNNWEAIAIRYLHLYIIQAGMTLANSRLIYHLALHNNQSVSVPSSLQANCLMQVKAQLTNSLSDKFRHFYISEATLNYELKRFMRISVYVSIINSPPYYFIRLAENRYILHRYWCIGDDGGERRELEHCEIKPYSPAENFANEIEMFYRAQTSVAHAWSERLPIEVIKKFSEHVDANVIAYAKQILENLFKNQESANTNYRSYSERFFLLQLALMQFFVDFLKDEYNRLVCHPVFIQVGSNSTMIQLKDDMIRTQKNILFSFGLYTNNTSANKFDMQLRQSLYDALHYRNVVVGYSRRSGVRMAFVENEETSTQNSQK